MRLAWLPTDYSQDFALAPGGDWLLATGEMSTDGMCPSHDGLVPSVERLSALTHLDVSYCSRLDLTPLQEMKKLRFVDVTGQRDVRVQALVAERPDLQLWEREGTTVTEPMGSSEESKWDRRVQALRESAPATDGAESR